MEEDSEHLLISEMKEIIMIMVMGMETEMEMGLLEVIFYPEEISTIISMIISIIIMIIIIMIILIIEMLFLPEDKCNLKEMI